MLAVQHFFLYLPSGEADEAAMAEVRQGFEAIGYRTTGSCYLLGYIPFGQDAAEVPQPELVVRLTPGADINTHSELAALTKLENAKAYALNKLRLFNLISCQPDSVELVSGPLSLLPYYMANIQGGTIVCSSILHLFAACPKLDQQMDEQGIFEFLCCGAALGPRTLHKYVRLASAGQRIGWERGKGMQVDRGERTRIPPADPSVGRSFAVDQIAAHIRDSFSQLPSKGLITLTGGYDSRLITCFAFEEKLDVRMVTIGYPRFEETKVAKALARSWGGSTTVFAPPHPDVLDLVPHWLECLEGLADAHTLFLANLLSLPEADGTPVFHGFIGDTLSGGLLDRICSETAKAPEEIATSIASYFLGGVSSQAGELLRLSASTEAATRDIQDEFVTGVAPHQTATLWNLENIQRRLVAHQLLYVGRRFMPVPVFYYRPLMEYWLSLPRMALDNRALLTYLYQKRWPKLSTLPHSEHIPSFIPRTRPAFQYVAGWVLRRYGWQAARKFGMDAAKLEARIDAWALWHGTTEVQRKKELKGLEETLSILQSRLGWEAPTPTDGLWSSCHSIERKQLLMLRRMYLLGEYAKSLPEPQHHPKVSTEKPEAAGGQDKLYQRSYR